MDFRFATRIAASAVLGLSCAWFSPAHATEGGGTLYPNGAENFLAAAMPPPGIYGMLFVERYHADRVNDADGHDLHVPGFEVRANAVVPRFIWVTGAKLLGGDLSWHVLAPIVDLKVSAAGHSQSKTGLGDLTTGPGIGYHHSAHLHSLLGVDLYVPTGGYDRNDLANIGRNNWAIEPLYIVSYVDSGGFNGDIKSGYIVNARNRDTRYRSGQEFHFDYSAGWGLGHGLTAGLGGYVYQQVSDDRQAGTTLADSKGKAVAVGPSMKYDSGKGWFVTAKWQKEVEAQNRAQGDAFWLKAVFPL